MVPQKESKQEAQGRLNAVGRLNALALLKDSRKRKAELSISPEKERVVLVQVEVAAEQEQEQVSGEEAAKVPSVQSEEQEELPRRPALNIISFEDWLAL